MQPTESYDHGIDVCYESRTLSLSRMQPESYDHGIDVCYELPTISLPRMQPLWLFLCSFRFRMSRCHGILW